MRKWLYRFVVTFGLLVLLLKLANWTVKHGHSLPILPQPNGYDELLTAASLVKPLPSDLGELTSEQIGQFADQNRPAIEQARKAFQMDSRVSIKPTKIWDDHHEVELTDLKRLAVAFGLEARFQQLSQHTNEATRCFLDMLRLAESAGKGGLIIDGINSLTIETIGVAMLKARLSELDAESCREAALEMEILNTHREMPATTFATERAWSAQRFGLVDLMGGFVMRQANAGRQAKFSQHSKEAIQRSQRLMLRLAARAYELDNQRRPSDVAALVPRYLRVMPRDPETGRELQELPAVLH